jgi:DNA-binding MarR family transcriptional regulator
MSKPLKRAESYESAKAATGLHEMRIKILLHLVANKSSTREAISTAVDCPVTTLRRHLSEMRIAGIIDRISDQKDPRIVTFRVSANGSKLIAPVIEALK